jgi:hypothetical protein
MAEDGDPVRLVAQAMMPCAAILRSVLVAGLAACSGSSAPTPAAAADGGERFDAACRFVPDGMVSYWFMDCLLVRSAQAQQGSGPWPVIAVMAARSFEEPHQMIGTGAADEVKIYDFGPGGVTAAARGWPVVPDESIEGCAVWHRSEEQEPSPTPVMSAIVAGRFVVQARRDLLVPALTGRGDRRHLLQSFGETPGLDWAAPALVFCLPRADVPGLMGEGRVGRAIFVGRMAPWRVEGWYLDGQVREADGFRDQLPQQHRGRYLVRTIEQETPAQATPEDLDAACNDTLLLMAWAYGYRTRF